MAASVSPLFSGEWRRNICKSILRASKFISVSGIRPYPCPRSGRFRYLGFESLGRAAHTLMCEDDFSELGPPVGQNGAIQLKLVTEKPEPHQKANPAAKAAVSWPFSLEDSRSTRDAKDVHKFSQTSKVKLQHHTSSLVAKQNIVSKVEGTMTVEQDKSQKLDSSCTVSIENVPSTFGLSDLVQAISVFGKVSSACIRSAPDGLNCCDVEFQNSESSRRAVLAGGINLEGIPLPIRSLLSPGIVSIRIEGIGKETTDPAVHTVCKLIGTLEGLEMDGKGSVNACFRVKNDAELQKIVKRLNNTIVDGCHWFAYQLPSNSTSMEVSEKDGKRKLGLQFNNRIVELKKLFELKKICSQDLLLLHAEILHLQGLPTTSYEP